MIERLSAELQARVASAIAGIGLVWAAKAATATRMGIQALVNTPGLVELLDISILLWLIAKWRVAARKRLPIE
jgi:hypothetical protein